MDKACVLSKMGRGQCCGQGTCVEQDGQGVVLWTRHMC